MSQSPPAPPAVASPPSMGLFGWAAQLGNISAVAVLSGAFLWTQVRLLDQSREDRATFTAAIDRLSRGQERQWQAIDRLTQSVAELARRGR